MIREHIYDYDIEEWSSARVLQEHVNQRIQDGWIPLGGVTVAMKRESTHAMTYVQAMVKCEGIVNNETAHE
jgi:hypothetical protein